MSLLTPSFFKSLYPEFKDETDELVEARIEIEKKKVDSNIFRSNYEEAVLCIVAHEFAYSNYAADGDELLGKEMTSFAAAGENYSFKASQDDENNDYKATVYGRKYLSMLGRAAPKVSAMVG